MRAPVAATMPNITSPAPPSTTSGTASTSAAIFGTSPSIQQDAAAGDRDAARAHAGDADQTDILRERRIGKGVEQPAQECADAVGPQTAGQRVAADRLAGDLAQREKHAKRL